MRGKSYSNNVKTKLKDFRGGETKIMNKKFIAIITALALVVTLLAPVGVQEASAKSDNWVDRVVSVTDDAYLGEDVTAPNLIIENDDGSDWGGSQTFRLTLPGDVDWKYANGASIPGAPSATVTVISDQIIEITTSGAWVAGKQLLVPIYAELDGATGELRVNLDARDSNLSSGSYTFANASGGDTIATVAKKEKVSRGAAQGATIIIDEVNVGSLSAGKKHAFVLKLPSNYSWDGVMDSSVGTLVQLPTGVVNPTVKVQGSNDKDLYVEFTTPATTYTTRQSIIIEPHFIVTRDAKYGDVSVDITSTVGDITAQSGIVIAEYHDDAVTVEIEEVKEILTGYQDDTNEFETAKITIEEVVVDSLATNGVIEFTLPGGVRIFQGKDFVIKNKTPGNNGTLTNEAWSENADGKYEQNVATRDFYINKDWNEFEVNVKEILGTSGNKVKLEMEIPLTIQGTKTGDIELEVSGGGIDKQSIVIAKAVPPVTAEVEVKDVRIGLQSQAVADITITENRAGAIREDGRQLFLNFALGRDKYFNFDGASYEVIEGDLKLDENYHSKTGSTLKIGIDDESTEPSKIKISNIKVTADRNAPEGIARLDITGPAIVNNGGNPGDFAGRVARFDFVNVITPATGDTRGTSVFTIDSMNYTVLESGVEVERTMDVAPYIRDSRTFLPVFFVAQALGVSENNIVWEPHSKTVTIMKGDRIASMQIGNKVLTVNGTPIQMDTAPEIKDGRTMLPIFYVGQALGASVEWDADARSVTVNQ